MAEQDKTDPRDEQLLNDQDRTYRFSEFDYLKGGLIELQNAQNDNERKDAREKVTNYYGQIIEQGLNHLDFMSDKLLLFEFPYPYDSRQAASFFEYSLNQVDGVLRDRRFKGEARDVLLSLHDALDWAHGSHLIDEGLSMTKFYYGGLDAMAAGLPDNKHKITSTDLQRTFSKDLRGSNSTDSTYNKLQIKVENVRGEAINYQDDFMYWRTLVAATSQRDYDKPTEKGLVSNAVLSPDHELVFIQQLFGSKDEQGNVISIDYKGHQIPSEILNHFAMKDTHQNREIYKSTMMALLEDGAREKLQMLYGGSKDQIEAYAKYISKKAEEIQIRDKNFEFTTNDRISSIVVKQGIAFEIGSGGSGALAWCWSYEKQKDGTYKKKVDYGGINAAGDWYTPEFYGHTNLGYDLSGRKRSSDVLASSHAYRTWVYENQSPLEKLGYPLKEIPQKDGWMYQEILRVIGDDEEVIVRDKNSSKETGKMKASEWRKSVGLEIDEDTRLALKEVLWFWETPYAGKDGKNMIYPFFIPHRFPVSFFNQVVYKNNDGTRRTLFDDLAGGKKLSEVNWAGLKEFQWDTFLVNLNMAERWLRFLREPGDSRRKEELVGGPECIKEIKKRAGLGTRGYFVNFEAPDPADKTKSIKKSVGPAVIEDGIIATMAMLVAAHGKENIMSSSIISEEIDTEKLRAQWLNLSAKWVRAAKWLPSVGTGDVVNDNNTIALLMLVYSNILYRIALEGGGQEKTDKINADNLLKKTRVKGDDFYKSPRVD